MSTFTQILSWSPPALYMLAAVVAWQLPGRAWLALRVATRGTLAAAMLVAASALWHGTLEAALLVGLLIAFLGWIIGDFAHHYLRAEPGQARFAVAYLATLAAVSIVVLSTHLLVLIGAWSASGVALHHLLTFYRQRPAALVVAHKKFLASRLAELCLIGAACLLYRQWGTLHLAEIGALARAAAPLPPAAGAAALLIAAAVSLRSAQLPLHGWLIQVMEAPTPVSALLHAGVVNLGGYVLIRLAPLMTAAPAAQGLLVAVGSLTAALAGLVMLTRVTVKVRLAWSTCSQMGFMLMECGLGLYDLALLHLLSHSLYKAHAFLTSGGATLAARQRRLVDAGSAQGMRALAWRAVLALPLALAVTLGSTLAWQRAFGMPGVPWIAPALLALGVSTLLWRSVDGRSAARSLLQLLLVTQLYLGWHWLLSGRLGSTSASAPTAWLIWVCALFGALYVLQLRLPARLYDWVYAGFYLDERFTRATFRIWPVRSPAVAPAARPRVEAALSGAAHER